MEIIHAKISTNEFEKVKLTAPHDIIFYDIMGVKNVDIKSHNNNEVILLTLDGRIFTHEGGCQKYRTVFLSNGKNVKINLEAKLIKFMLHNTERVSLTVKEECLHSLEFLRCKNIFGIFPKRVEVCHMELCADINFTFKTYFCCIIYSCCLVDINKICKIGVLAENMICVRADSRSETEIMSLPLPVISNISSTNIHMVLLTDDEKDTLLSDNIITKFGNKKSNQYAIPNSI